VQASSLKFQPYARKNMEFNDSTTLHYADKGTWALAAVVMSDISLYEAMNFFDSLESELTKTDGPLSDIDSIQTSDAA
jgi:hypothetical protein